MLKLSIPVRDIAKEREHTCMFNALEFGVSCAEHGLNLQAAQIKLARTLQVTDVHTPSTPHNYDN